VLGTALPLGADLDHADQVMEKGETGYVVHKGHDFGTRIEVVLEQVPLLSRAARYVKHLGRLTLGDTLGVYTISAHVR
jgi:hypothetical protein